MPLLLLLPATAPTPTIRNCNTVQRTALAETQEQAKDTQTHIGRDAERKLVRLKSATMSAFKALNLRSSDKYLRND